MFRIPAYSSRGVRAVSAAVFGSVLTVLGGMALAQQDKYTLNVLGGLSFSEFKGYEVWQFVSLSQNDKLVSAILANPVMIDAYRAGIPGNGKPFPDGAKMAKIHWNPAKQEFFPETTVPGTQHDVDFMVRDSKRFVDSGGWGYAVFEYNAASDKFSPGTLDDQPPQHRVVRGRDEPRDREVRLGAVGLLVHRAHDDLQRPALVGVGIRLQRKLHRAAAADSHGHADQQRHARRPRAHGSGT